MGLQLLTSVPHPALDLAGTVSLLIGVLISVYLCVFLCVDGCVLGVCIDGGGSEVALQLSELAPSLQVYVLFCFFVFFVFILVAFCCS